MPARLVVESVGITEVLVRLRARTLRLEDMHPEMVEAQTEIYRATQEWYDASGDGEWPQLAESTVQRKESSGASDPERILFDTGNLYESVTSPSGPYSWTEEPNRNSIAFGVDWDVGGYQIAVVHFYGDDNVPARPIWPAHDSGEYRDLRAKLTELMFRGI